MKKHVFCILLFTIGLISCKGTPEQDHEEEKQVISMEEDSIPQPEKADETEVNVPVDYNMQRFIPRNYTILDTTRGDLNLDGIQDMVMVLKKIDEEENSDMSDVPGGRPLYLLIGQKDGTLKLERKNDNTVYCYDCGGIFGDPFTGIAIKDGYFSVEHYGGSNWRWTKIVTYKYSKADKEWYLHKDGGESFHTADPEHVKTIILTTKDFGVVKFENYNILSE